MKAFIAAIVLFCVATAGAFGGSYYVGRLAESFSEEISEIRMPEAGEDLRAQEEALGDIFDRWEGHHTLIKVLVNHPIKSSIDGQFRVAMGYCAADDEKELTAALAALVSSFDLLHEISEISIGNII